MKLLRASLLALFLGPSFASAASFYFGVRVDAPIAFEQVAQATNTIVLPMLGIQAGLDFDSASSGAGIRLALSSQVVSGGRFAGDIYVRSSFLPELSAYLGGGAIMLEPRARLFYFNAHLLAGLEYQVSPGIDLFAEVSPGAALGFGQNSCFGPPRPDPNFVCGSLVPFTLEAAIGLNFRF